MKTSLILPFLIGALISCSDKESLDLNQCPKKWQLVKMTGNIADIPPATGTDMAWQEWYLLYSNNTFSKTRERDNVITEETGTYSIQTLSDGKYFDLTYPSRNDLLENCSIEPKELLKVNSENELMGTSSMCDGPGLFYNKVEYNCTDR